MAKKRAIVPKLEPEVAVRGRPSKYTAALAEKILARLAEGETLRAICRDEGMPPHSTVMEWANRNAAFADQYAKAREKGYSVMADEIVDIADDGRNDTYTSDDEDGETRTNHDVIARSRLRVDTRKWLLSKCLPKIYGDRLTSEIVGPNGGPLQMITGSVVVVIKDLGERARNQLRGILLAAKAKEQ